MRMHRGLLLWLCLSLLAGCAGLSVLQNPPVVSLSGIRLVEVDLLEQRYSLRLRVMNRADETLRVRGMDYQLWMNGKEFAHGVSNQEFSVEPLSEQLIEVEVVSNLASVMRQLQDLDSGGLQRISYRLEGKLGLAGRAQRIPFEFADEIALGRSDRGT